MEIETLNRRKNIDQNPKLIKAYLKIENLIEAINKKELAEQYITHINIEIKSINSFSGNDKELIKILRKTYDKILVYIEKELKLVKRNHYQNSWIGLGIMAGVLLPYFFRLITSPETWNSMGFGIPMGMIIGLLAGKNRDEKAKKAGKQLDL